MAVVTSTADTMVVANFMVSLCLVPAAVVTAAVALLYIYCCSWCYFPTGVAVTAGLVDALYLTMLLSFILLTQLLFALMLLSLFQLILPLLLLLFLLSFLLLLL